MFRKIEMIQVILCRKPSFFHQLTQNMTTDCSLNYKKTTSSAHVVYIELFAFTFRTTTCTELVESKDPILKVS